MPRGRRMKRGGDMMSLDAVFMAQIADHSGVATLLTPAALRRRQKSRMCCNEGDGHRDGLQCFYHQILKILRWGEKRETCRRISEIKNSDVGLFE